MYPPLLSICVHVCVVRELLTSGEKNPDFPLIVIFILLFIHQFAKIGKYVS